MHKIIPYPMYPSFKTVQKDSQILGMIYKQDKAQEFIFAPCPGIKLSLDDLKFISEQVTNFNGTPK